MTTWQTLRDRIVADAERHYRGVAKGLGDELDALIAAVRADAPAEVERLRAALEGLSKAVAFQNAAWGSVPGQAQADFAVREAQDKARAALATTVAPAPADYAPVYLDGGGDPTFDQIDGYLYAHFGARATRSGGR